MRLAGVAALGLLLGGGLVAALWQPWAGAGGSPGSPRQTAVAERTTLSAHLVLSASLEYSAPTALVGVGGTLTRLPQPGEVVGAGQALYEVDGHAVVAFRGARPLWRSVESGMSDGPDVQQVEQNLADLGFGDGLTVDNTFTAATERAIRAWQKAAGRERTGVIEQADVVMVSAPAVRISGISALVGASATGPVLSYTEPGIHGRMKVTAAQLTQLAPGMAVTVRLPSGSETPATIAAIDPGGAATSDPAKTTTPSARVEFPDQSLLEGLGLPALRVTVGTGGAENALVVPVTALVALAGGGYAVEIVDAADPPATPPPTPHDTSSGSSSAGASVPAGSRSHTVPVEIGLIADSRVQITAGELDEGDRVVVPG
ncbi:hypothetical protein B7R21_00070 [Subtercola boreus]|uniref:Peptidoglycan binding-like domain-containing protein n=1 Tax=Subtercola boreus TaxID=120213 RepID=A0A3E0W4M1_9MICO|nr:hypothetical protein B7R21_00070 [Subtercola boreus]